jgi:two-component system, cell cycle sensor histidine kinase and response regulator CckA
VDEPSAGAGERVLIVEDDDMVRSVSALILERAGYDVVTATNGQEALNLFDERESFDLMVTDLVMPTMTGIQLAEELGRRGVELPVVYMSGYAEGVTDHTPDGPNTAFLPKPFSGDDLSTAVRQLLDG